MDKIIIGQEAICPDGLGRVAAFDSNWIQVDTYVNNRGCKWGVENVELIDPRKPKIVGSTTETTKDLLQALQGLLAPFELIRIRLPAEQYADADERIAKAKAAIEKAKGETA